MKSKLNVLAVLVAVSGSHFATSKLLADCGSKHTADRKDIVDTAVAAGSFKTLVTAVKAAGLVDTLKSTGPYTVFAPTDEAFAKLPKATLEDLLKPQNREKLKAILTFHVVPGRVPAKQVVKLNAAKTVNGQQVDLVVTDSELSIDGAKVVQADIMCSNGVIHVIDSVMLPNDKDIIETAKNTDTFKTLIAAVKAAGLDSALSGEGFFTVFAPTDEAFAKLPEGTLDSLLQPENRERLASILKYHVVSGRAFASDALAMKKIDTLEGTELRVRIVDGKPRVNDAGIIKTDIDASNGVIHVIDSVMLPPEGERADAGCPRSLIETAIERGASLYNKGQHAACVAIYEIAAMGLLAGPEPAMDYNARRSLRKALAAIRRSHHVGRNAWTLRHALDEIYASMDDSNY